MADVHTKEIRSYNMSRIRAKNTGPEMMVRRFLYANGIRYRLYCSDLPGKPDIVLSKCKTIIDVRGCFWHGHEGCKYGDQIKTASEGIARRIRSAIERDKRNEQQWQELGWKFIIVWDSCELELKKKTSERRDKILKNLLKRIQKNCDTCN